MAWLFVALGGALGAVARYAISLVFPYAGSGFPLGTFFANSLGAFLMGVLYVVIVDKALVDPVFRLLFMVGGMGALTTFSTFSIEALSLIQNGHHQMAAMYIFASVGVCLCFVYLGMNLTQKFL